MERPLDEILASDRESEEDGQAVGQVETHGCDGSDGGEGYGAA